MSSTRNIIKNYQIITNGAMTGNVTSLEVDCTATDRGSIQLVWTGTPTGTFEVQGAVSVDQLNAGVTWSAIATNPPVISVAGAAGNHFINMEDIGWNKIRVVYTFGSGTGTLNAYLTLKGD